MPAIAEVADAQPIGLAPLERHFAGRERIVDHQNVEAPGPRPIHVIEVRAGIGDRVRAARELGHRPVEGGLLPRDRRGVVDENAAAPEQRRRHGADDPAPHGRDPIAQCSRVPVFIAAPTKFWPR